jgi:hypothetical protein
MSLPNAECRAKSSTLDSAPASIQFDLRGRVIAADGSTSSNGRGHE